MSESLRNDGRIWVPKKKGDKRPPHQIPEDERDYYLERKYPELWKPCSARRGFAQREAGCDEGRGVGESGLGVYLDFADAIKRLGKHGIDERYGNLFDMYDRITGENPYEVPMRIYPAIHYTMGGLWVDYNLMSTIPGLFVFGEANFSDHGANRLGASALMQGLADGYFVLPYTIGDYLATTKLEKVDTLARRRFAKPKPASREHDEPAARNSRQADGHFLSSRTRQIDVGPLRHGANRSRIEESAAARFPNCVKSSGKTSMCSAAAKSSIRLSKTPDAWRTFWSLAN